MSNDITYMDCWHYVAPLLPVNTDFGQDVTRVLNELEKRRRTGRKLGEAIFRGRQNRRPK